MNNANLETTFGLSEINKNFFKEEFNSYKELKSRLDDWCALNYVQLVTRTSKKIKPNIEMDNIDAVENIIYESIYFTCIHYGQPRAHKQLVNNSRPNQVKNAIGCKCFFHYKLIDNSLVLVNYNAEHINHKISKNIWENYPKQRKLNEIERTQLKNLFKVKVPLRNIRRETDDLSKNDIFKRNLEHYKKAEDLNKIIQIDDESEKLKMMLENISNEERNTQNRILNKNQKYKRLKVIFEDISSILCDTDMEEFLKNEKFFKEILDSLRNNNVNNKISTSRLDTSDCEIDENMEHYHAADSIISSEHSDSENFNLNIVSDFNFLETNISETDMIESDEFLETNSPIDTISNLNFKILKKFNRRGKARGSATRFDHSSDRESASQSKRIKIEEPEIIDLNVENSSQLSWLNLEITDSSERGGKTGNTRRKSA